MASITSSWSYRQTFLLLLCFRALTAPPTGVMAAREESSMEEKLDLLETRMKLILDNLNSQRHYMEDLEIQMETMAKDNAEMAAKLNESQSQVAELQARLNSTETRLDATEVQVTDHQTRLNSTEVQVGDLKKESEGHAAQLDHLENPPKVAFSVGLGSGQFSAANPLIYQRVITNVGNGYNSSTGIFTCRLKGVYQFRFTAANWPSNRGSSQSVVIQMYKNDQQLMLTFGYNNHGQSEYVSNGMILELEQGDTVYMVLPGGLTLYDNSENHNVFSGFLLYAM